MQDMRGAILARCRDLETEILVRQAVLRELRGLLGDVGDRPEVARDVVVAPSPVAPPVVVPAAPAGGNGHAEAAPRKKPGPPSRWPQRRKDAAAYLAANGPQTLPALILNGKLSNTDRPNLREDPWFEVSGGRVSLTQDGWAFVRGEGPTCPPPPTRTEGEES